MFHKRLKPGFWLALIATLMAVTVVVLGSFTRLVDAGLGCPDWPGCYGHFWAPMTEDQIAIANATFPEIPVDHSKTWPEMVHRYFASMLGVLIIGLVLIAIKHRRLAAQPFKLPIFLLAFVILQGTFGAWTVTMKLLPQVVTAHLLGGFTTTMLLVLLTFRLSGWRYKKLGNLPLWKKPIKLATATLAVVIVQIFLGGWTATNYAALSCPDFPKCQTQWWPEMDFVAGLDVLHPVGPNYLGGTLDLPARTAIHMSHRIGAIVVTVFSLALTVALWRAQLTQLAVGVLLFLSIQIVLGISNVVFSLPLSVAVLHNLFGAVLMIYLVLVNVVLRRQETSYV